MLAKSGERLFILGLGGDLLVANAVNDGLFEDFHDESGGEMRFGIVDSNGQRKYFPAVFAYRVTDVGVDFIQRYAKGLDIE